MKSYNLKPIQYSAFCFLYFFLAGWSVSAQDLVQPIPYAPLLERDVAFVKKVERIIDLRQKPNLVLKHPRMHLGNFIYDLALKGEILPYMNDSFTQFYDGKTFKEIGSSEEVVYVYDEQIGADVEAAEPIVEPFNFEQRVMKFKVIEEWYFDKQSSTYFPRIVGIAPLYVPLIAGQKLPEMPLCYFKYEELRPYLVNFEIFNKSNQSASAQISADHFFQKRLFSSFVSKEWNVWDLPIAQLSEFKDDGIKALLEANRIKNDMINFEHDLWEY